jgi:squalene synthase HpnC
VAFRQDQTVPRYQTMDDVLDYCRYSANPVGRLVLYACGYRFPEMFLLSDYTCTALQLANFWQDVSSDYSRGRIYLPLDDLNRYGVDEATIARRDPSQAFRDLLHYEVDYTRELFAKGLPLISMVDQELALDLDLFSRGGLAILDAIEARKYDVLTERPVVSKGKKLGLVGRAVWGKIRGRRLK